MYSTFQLSKTDLVFILRHGSLWFLHGNTEQRLCTAEVHIMLDPSI